MIADDFTGALDSGVSLACAGLNTVVSLGDKVSFDADDVQALVINADCRHDEPEMALEKMKAILKQWSGGFEVCYMKTDSALRGNISSAFLAASEVTGRRILFIPAFPDAGRVTRGGKQYIDGVLLEESSFRLDPLNPMRTSRADEIAKGNTRLEIRICEPDDDLPGDGDVVIFNCEDNRDLEILRDKLKGSATRCVLAGCAGFAAQIPAMLDRKTEHIQQMFCAGPMLIFSGSANQATFDQLETAKRAGVPVLVMRTENDLSEVKETAIEYLRGGKSVILTTAVCREDVSTSVMSSEQISALFTRLSEQIFKRYIPEKFCIIGGDTCMAVLNHFGVERVRALCEIERGVPVSEFDYRGKQIKLVTKSGGLGSEQAILNMIRFFR
ncbi:four-carbon acid sugar kinase family protein [Anaerolentibacter hominis]|uniref:four-carbon acid sugar kinase family protein n=1 Tax=Anaerolentibacter hominis TaxID=3079009 RepID=UPI0031B8B014